MDPWDNIPIDAACEIISHLTNVADILNYMGTSTVFRELAGRCVVQLESSQYIEIPVAWLNNFPNLRRTGDQIRIVVNLEDISMNMVSLPQLREGNFIFRGVSEISKASAQAEREFLELLNRLGLDGKLPNANYRIMAPGNIGIIVQGNQALVFGLYRQARIRERFPQLNFVFPPEAIGQALMSSVLRSFLTEADFGLVDPTLPPSEFNPQLSFDEIARTGVIDYRLLSLILTIYCRYHRLWIDNYMIVPDELLNRYFQQSYIRHIRSRGAHLETPDGWSFIGLRGTLSTHYMNPKIETLDQYDVPGEITLERYQEIADQAQRIDDLYSLLATFYTTQGSLR